MSSGQPGELVDYVSYRQAAEILGIHPSNVAAHVQRGNLPTRGRSTDDPHRASLLRADVEELGRELADRAHRAKERQEALAAARERGAPPDNVSDWVSLPQAAAILDVSEQYLRRLCAQEKVPATKVGQKWWMQRMHAENVALARQRRDD